MIEKIIPNLVESLLPHKFGKISTISSHYYLSGNNLIWSIENSTQEILGERVEENQDVERSRYRNQRLDLAKEILSITGISFRKTDPERKIIEISIPSGSYRHVRSVSDLKEID